MLKVRRLGIDTCHETVAFLARRCPFYRAEEFVALARIEISGGGRRIFLLAGPPLAAMMAAAAIAWALTTVAR